MRQRGREVTKGRGRERGGEGERGRENAYVLLPERGGLASTPLGLFKELTTRRSGYGTLTNGSFLLMLFSGEGVEKGEGE